MNTQEQAQQSPLEVAINVLIQAVEVGREKGAYTFAQSAIINEQLTFLTTKPEGAPQEGPQEAPEAEFIPDTIEAPKKK
jgi:hypothetical protein